MNARSYLTGRSFLYDAMLSILYAWGVFEAYSYDAKTQTTGILIYVLVYGGFALLVRSQVGIVMMNLLSAFTLPLIFMSPIMHQAGSYFDLQPYMGIGLTILIALVQSLICIPLLKWSKGILSNSSQYTWSVTVAFALAVVLTVWAAIV